MSRLRQAALAVVLLAAPASAQSFPQVNLSTANVAQVQQQFAQAQQINQTLNRSAAISVRAAEVNTGPLARSTASQDLARPVESPRSAMSLAVRSLAAAPAPVAAAPKAVMMSSEEYAREDLPRVEERLKWYRSEMWQLSVKIGFELLSAAEPFLVRHEPPPAGTAQLYSGEGESTMREFMKQWNEYQRLWALNVEYRRRLGLPIPQQEAPKQTIDAIVAARRPQPSDQRYEVHVSDGAEREDSRHDFSHAEHVINSISNVHF